MKILVFTGAGISRASELKTYRDEGGLWNGYKMSEVCTDEAWRFHPGRVLDFYNGLRREMRQAQPNRAHELVAKLEEKHQVAVVTQNVDDLHERAGSTGVFHLHGNIMQKRPDGKPLGLEDCDGDINIGEEDADGNQYRPHVVFYGEGIYDFDDCITRTKYADVLIVVGTTAAVYPAALIAEKTAADKVWIVDPNPPKIKFADDYHIKEVVTISKPAVEGMEEVYNALC